MEGSKKNCLLLSLDFEQGLGLGCRLKVSNIHHIVNGVERGVLDANFSNLVEFRDYLMAQSNLSNDELSMLLAGLCRRIIQFINLSKEPKNINKDMFNMISSVCDTEEKTEHYCLSYSSADLGHSTKNSIVIECF